MADAMKVWAMKVFATRSADDRLFSALALGALLSFAAPSIGWGQGLGGMGGADPGRRSPTPSVEPDKPAPPAPDAVPGAKARAPAAPSTHSPTDLRPTDALFDAINRGDIASARDALNRGADMDGVNVLGMTPMELSVDLGRNDISFLLLSMRGEDSSRGSRAVGRDVAGEAPGAKGVVPPKTAKVKSAAPTKTSKAKDTSVVSRSVAKPKLFANDGGAPLPSVGFLGFDPRSATN
jgi:hypothetical protein